VASFHVEPDTATTPSNTSPASHASRSDMNAPFECPTRKTFVTANSDFARSTMARKYPTSSTFSGPKSQQALVAFQNRLPFASCVPCGSA
jgi:hypothetical protein